MPASHTMPTKEMQHPLTLDNGEVYFGRDEEGHRVFRDEYPCYQCGEPIIGALVYKLGCTQPGQRHSNIVLHPKCAEQLATELIDGALAAKELRAENK